MLYYRLVCLLFQSSKSLLKWALFQILQLMVDGCIMCWCNSCLFVCLFFCCKYFNSMNKISVKLICPAIFLIIRVWCNIYMFISVTTYLHAPYTSWITGRGAGQPFVVSANITYAEGRYLYPLLYLHYCKQNQKIYIVCVRNSLISKIWSLSKLLGCS